MIRFRLILLLVAKMLLVFPFPGNSQSTGSVDSLSKPGALRPINLIKEQAHWYKATPDQFTYWLDSGLYGYYGPQPRILLDRIPININFFGWQNLNMLPIQLSNIDRAVTTDDRQSGQYISSPAGSIDFITKRPKPALSVSGSLYFGNETGDPGPWIYDSTRVTPNVDRWGPDLTGSMSYSKDGWYAKSSVALRNHQQTDPRTHRRLHRTMRALGTTNFNKIQTTSSSGFVETGYTSEHLNISIRGLEARDENYLFLQPFGREVPSETSYRQLALAGSHKGDGWTLDLKYIGEEQKLQRRNPEHSYIFNWDERRNTFVAALSQKADEYILSSGFNWEFRDIEAPGITDNRHLIGTYFFKTELLSGNGHKSVIETSFDYIDESTARNFKAALYLQPLPYWSLELSGRYNEILPIQQQSIAYWVLNEGYTFFDELGIPYDAGQTMSKNRLSILALKIAVKLFIPLELELSARYLNHLEQNIPWQEVAYSSTFDSEPGTFVVTQESGSRFQLHSSLIHTPVPWIKQSLHFQFNSTLSGTNRYSSYYRQIPHSRVSYRLEVAPTKNFEVALEGSYQSSTRWYEFLALDGQEYEDIDNQFPVYSGTFQSKVPSHFNLDIAVKKWLWDRRLNMTFSIQNLLNDEVYLHPMGADKSLLFNIKAEASF